MFLSNEWNSCVYSTKVDGQAIAQLVRHDQRFWMGVEELCVVNEPLVKVLRLVDGQKPQWATCMRSWIGPRKLSIGTMRTRGKRAY
jgi:hypothetical protein